MAHPAAVMLLCSVVSVVATVDHVLPSPQRARKLTHEILYIEDGYPDERTYKFEDFFWTGSGDGDPDNTDYPWSESTNPSTIYKTKTVMSTVYVSVSGDNQNDTETGTECTINCGTAAGDGATGNITPTPTFGNNTVVPSATNATNTTADRQFWLLTIIRNNGEDPVLAVLEKRLAKLYSVAFRRQQERHLGINNRKKRAAPKQFQAENKPVNVYIHNMERNPENNQIEVLYHVLVSGKPVTATTAASDMKLVTDDEAAKELGFPILTKAEPYIKVEWPQGLARTRDTWLFVGIAAAAIILLLLIVTIFTWCLNKKKKNDPVASGTTNRQQVFHREAEGHANAGYIESQGEIKYQSGKRNRKSIGIQNASTESLTSRYPDGRPVSSPSTTTSSCSSIDISPIITPKHKSFYSRKRRQFSKKPSTVNKVLMQEQISRNIDIDSGSDRQGSEVGLIKDPDGRKMSPKSYLSMPSVKSFPRSSIPEPLSKVLEPVSVLHLDVTDDAIPEPSPIFRNNNLTRHGSMGYEDPGVVGPVVWNLHNKRMQNVSDTEDDDQKNTQQSQHTHRMRKRFHELLDDTFTLFGSSRDSQVEPADFATNNSAQPARIDYRGHSAVVKPASEAPGAPKPRPKTSGPRRVTPSPGVDAPRGAWASGTPSPLVRPLSAGPFHHPAGAPSVDIERILAEGALLATDPAVPLIAAIKTELKKCSLPGSTTNLAE